MTQSGDIRFSVPLYTVAEAARYVRVPASTYATWARGYDRSLPGRGGGQRHVHGAPVITAFTAPKRGWPTIPFVGLAESLVLSAFRMAGVSMQHIRLAIPVLAEQVGVEHALASQRLYTDGAVILFDYATHGSVDQDAAEELSGLTRIVDGQRVFAQVVRDYLHRVAYEEDGWAGEIGLPYGSGNVLRVRPDRGGGKPLFVSGGAPLDAMLARWRAGDGIAELAADFEVPPHDLEDALRGAVAAAA